MKAMMMAAAAAALMATGAHATGKPLSPAEARSLAEATSRADADARATATAKGGDAKAYGGDAWQAQSARTGDVTATQSTAVGGQQASLSVTSPVTIEGDRNPVSTAIAPNVVVMPGNGNAECYWTLSIAGAGQGASRGVSGGAGLFPFRLETCLLLTLADRHMDGYCADPASDACRLIRRVEESLE